MAVDMHNRSHSTRTTIPNPLLGRITAPQSPSCQPPSVALGRVKMKVPSFLLGTIIYNGLSDGSTRYTVSRSGRERMRGNLKEGWRGLERDWE